ncbi:MAG: RNA-binding S4 domain-containing protein [Rhizobiaceae bacterium]
MAGEGRQRLDRWLFFARIAKSRTLAQKMVEAGRVRINANKTMHADAQVAPGDVLTVTLDRRILVCRILTPGTRRGPAAEARLIYEDLSGPPSSEAPPDQLPRLREIRRPPGR